MRSSYTSLRLELGGSMDRGSHILIRSAAADIEFHDFIDIGVGGSGVLREQRCGAHDLAGLAVAALRNVLLDPGLLDGMIAVGGKAFDGDDALACDGRYLHSAGARRGAIYVDRACAAQRHAAAEFGAGVA